MSFYQWLGLLDNRASVTTGYDDDDDDDDDDDFDELYSSVH